MAAPTPYMISVPQEQIDALKVKLKQATFPDELEEAGWDMGAPLADVKRLAKVWEGWDWRRAEEGLNSRLPMFSTGMNYLLYLSVYLLKKNCFIESYNITCAFPACSDC